MNRGSCRTRLATARRSALVPPLALVALAVFSGMLAGCGSHDDEVSPQSGASQDPGGQTGAQSTGINLLDLVVEVTELLPAWRDGQMGGIAAERTLTPVWNAVEQTWTFADSTIVESPELAVANLYTYSVQYWHARSPGPDYVGADEMWADVHIVQSGHAESQPGAPDAFTTDYAYTYAVRVHLSELLSTNPRYSGSGILDGRYDFVSASASAHRTVHAPYTLLLGLGAGWCPTGTVEVDLDPYTFYGNFDGDESVGWTLYRNDAELAQGERTIRCPGLDRR